MIDICQKIINGKRCGGTLRGIPYFDPNTDRWLLECDRCGRKTLGEKRKIKKRRNPGRRGRSSRR